MKKLILLFSIVGSFLFGCSNSQQKDSVESNDFEEKIQQIDSLNKSLEKETAEIKSTIEEVDKLLEDIE